MPEVRGTAQQRRTVARRALDCCEYCRSQARFSMQSFSIEHIVPIQKGGPTTLENLALSCQGCNGHKSVKTEGLDPVSRDLVPLYNPRTHRWKDHFTWNEDFARILGLTEIGRATIETLHLNREGLVNLRQILYARGEHPPAEPD